MSHPITLISRRTRRNRSAPRRMALLGVATILSMLLSLFPQVAGLPVPTAEAHNLQTRMVSMFMDSATQALLDARMANPGWSPPDPLLESGDVLGLIIKVVPRDGTTTGVGGHIDFYVPNGVQVTDVGYVVPDGAGGFTLVSMKGQSPIAIGDGPIGAKATTQLIGLGTNYTNILGVTEAPVVTTSGLHRGTIAGVYGDTGIFFSTDPDTAYGSWQKFTGDWNNANPSANRCGSAAFTTVNGKTLVNNSGDTVVPCNKWDAEQLMAWGVKGGTYGATAPIVDYADGRGNAPWGFASGVGGPQSGYAWNFDWDEWQASGKTAADMRDAMDPSEIGPWQRIKYSGSRISRDQPGLISTVLGQANVDGSNVGATVPLPATTSQTDTTSPKAIRWAVGQLTAFRPEYAWVKIKVNSVAEIVDPSGCPVFKADTFGGDAGGTDNGKDHLWRYYEPTEVTWNGCLAAQKTASREIVKVGDTYQYKLKVYNFQNFTLSSVVVRDPIPSGVTFISAVPVQNSGPSPLVWNVGTLLPGQKWEATVTVKATATGFIDNCITIDSGQLPTQTVCDSTVSGSYPYLVPSKTVTPTATPPGSTVTYDLLVKNTGTGPTGNPVVISDFLSAGLTYDSTFPAVVTVNGAVVTNYTLNITNPANPIVTVPVAINGGNQLTLKFRATVPSTLAAGVYCNSYSVTQNGVPLTTGSEACLQVNAGTIGDTVFRDWNGNGVQDPEDEGMPGVQVTLKAGSCPGGATVATTTTDAGGKYLFAGLSTPATYCVSVPTPGSGGVPTGYTLTADPDGSPATTSYQVSLAANQTVLTADWGYKPGGAGSIGDKVFEDVDNNGVFGAGDFGIPNVTVWLYEDTNNNGVIDAGADALVATATSNASGDYLFSGLATGINYLVKVDKSDPDIQAYFNGKYDPDPVPYQLSTAEMTSSPNLSTTPDLDNDFGFWRVLPASIGDQVFIDNNGNGVYDAGDTPLAGITVTLYRDGVPFATTSSGPDGTYLFDNLGPGNYRAEVDTADPDLPGGLFATATQYEKTLIAGESYLTADFPFVRGLTKTVDKAYANPAGTLAERTLTFTLRPFYPGGDLLENVRIIDPLPTGTSYVSGSANAGGVFGAYTPIPAVPGNDPTGGPAGTTTLDTAMSVSTNFVNVGGSVNVTLNVKSSAAVSNVSPTDFEVDGGAAACTGPTPASANVPAGGAGVNFVWACTLSDVGEYIFSAAAEDATAAYTWPEASSASVLSAPGGGPNVVTWNLGSNAAGVPGETLTSGRTAGIYTFRGGNTKEFSKYSLNTSAWTTRNQPTNGIEKGGSLTTDGAGTIYALEGNSKIFYKYDINANSWSQLPGTSDNVSEGGAVQYLKVGATEYVFATLGGSNRFRRYTVGGSWANAVNTPANVKKGGALTTDGTYIYALRGDRQKSFWRCNATVDAATGSCFGTGGSWTALANTPENVGWGGALTRVGNYIYALRGDGKTDFWRCNYTTTGNADSCNTGWDSTLAKTLGAVADGGALTTDGTYVYALQGKTKTFWRYNPATNSWATLASTNFLGNVGQGGALVYDVGSTPIGRFSTAVATPSLVSTGNAIKVTLRFQASTAVNNVAAGALNVANTGGASASCGSAVLRSADDDIVDINDPVIYEWTCTATAGAGPGSLTFSSSATGDGPTTFPSASSKSVLVSPVLTFQATVNTSGAPPVIKNTGILAETSGAIGTLPSNTTQTATAGSIGDRVWNDLDADGVQDTGELGLAGVKVCVYQSNGTTLVGCDTTDASGTYRVYGLPAANYVVRIDPTTYPTGYLPTTATSLNVGLAAGQQYNDADFGLATGAGSIGDTVWLDANNNGSLDGTEQGLPNITVRLYKDLTGNGFSGDDVLVASDATDANGLYLFENLPAGNYVVVVDEANSNVISPYDGNSYTLAAAMDPVFGTNLANVTLSSGQAYLNADFPYNWSGSIGDLVWWDDDLSGTQNGSEQGIPNAAVLLYYDANNNGILDPASGDYQIGFTLTDASGNYLFGNLPPGRYFVDVYEDSITTDGNRNIAPTTANVVYKNLGPKESYLNADFGYYKGALVQGSVFHDDNRTATFDAGEAGLQGIAVYLCTAGTTPCNAANAYRQTTTDAAGHFSFVVPEGDYTLTYNTGQTTAAGFPDPTTPTSFTFHAYPGENWYENTHFDFGVDYSGKIGDTVWNDVDGDGVGPNGNGAAPGNDNSEPGLAGVTVMLYKDTDNSNTLTAGDVFLAVAATDASGKYLFEGLADGSYIVVVNAATLPANFGATYDNSGPANGVGQADIAGGNTDRTVDFGYKYNPPTGTSVYPISGYVWEDADGDGVFDAGEPQLYGVQVTLACGVFGTYVLTTAPGLPSGNYLLDNVPNGTTCTITVNPATLPSTAYAQTGDPDVSPPACTGPACDNKTTVTVSGGPVTDRNFGYRQHLGSISGTVCEGNGNGLCESGEPGIQGVTVDLWYAGPDGILGTTDDITTTVTTDLSGNYTFPNLAPGRYRVIETDKTGYISLNDADGGDPNRIDRVLDFGPDGIPGNADDRLVWVDQDFEDNRLGDVTVTKTLLLPVDGTATISDTVKFEIVVKNTGQSLLTTVPLWDYYSPACLENPVTTPPAPGAGTNPALGVLHWPNLAPAGGLLPGKAVTVTVDFHANITKAMYWKEGGWIDYAAKGMPDFDQKQDAWGTGTAPGAPDWKWTFCGPVAAANSLWWFDSKFEPNPVPPPAVNDGYNLVSAYGQWDDHDPRNVQPFVNNLNTLMGTGGNGTNVHIMATSLAQYITNTVGTGKYTVAKVKAPSFEWVESEVRRSEDVILLLGFWQQVGSTFERVGGHFVTVAGVDSLNKKIGFSDPYRNAAEAGGLGRVLPNPHPYLHPAQPADEVHNNAKYLSHDVYPAVLTTTPGGVWGPEGYAVACEDVLNFQGQNVPPEFQMQQTTCNPLAPVIVEVEYAVAVSPKTPTVTCDPTTNIAVVSGAYDEFGLLLPEAQAHAQVKIEEQPAIGVAKRVVDPVVNHGDGTYTVEYSVLVQNVGNTALNNVQVTDDLAATFSGATSWNVVAGSVSATGLTANSGFDGTTDKNLLAGVDSLASLAQGTVTFRVKVTPGSKLGTYYNTAVGSGVSPLGATATDDSQDGLDTDPDTPGLTPADNPQPGDDGVPTPVLFTENPVIGIAKAVDLVTNNGNGTYVVTFTLTVKNYGDVILTNLVITDTITTQFAGLSPTGFTAISGSLTANGTWNGTAGSNVLAAGQSLAKGATGTVKIRFTVTPVYPRTVNNAAYAAGDSPAGAKVTDQSTVGTDPDNDGGDPGNDNNNNPADNNTPTPVTFTENPVLGAAKNLESVENLGGGQYRVTYLITVRNYGNVNLSSVQVTDNLASTFTGASSWSVESVTTSANLTVSGSYTGSPPNTSLLAGTDSLAVGASGTITLKVIVTPGSKLGPYNNQATASGDGPLGTPVADLSQNGTNPDPDGDQNPGNNSEPTPVTFTAVTQIGVAKAVVGTPVNRGDGTYDVTYSILVVNMGDTLLSNVQVTDNLNTTFGAGKHAVQSVTSTTFSVNFPGYNGSTNTNLLLGTDTLAAGASGTITLVVRVTPGGNLGPYNNRATGSATGPGGTPTTDNSQDGTDPDPDGDKNPTNNNVLTPVSFTENPAIGAAKAVQSQTNNGDGTFTVVYEINVKNLGNIVLNNVQVTDNLATTFAGATSWSATITSVSAGWTANPGYNGSSNIALLTSTGNSLAVNETKTIILTVTVRPATSPAAFNNQATATGVSPAGTTVTDLSQDGTTIQPGVDSVTPVTLTQTRDIAVDKTGPVASSVGSTAVYNYAVTTGAGDVRLSSVTVADDVCGAATYASGDDGDGYLEPGETWIFTCSYVIQASDPDPLVNTATAQGFDPLNRKATAQDLWSTRLQPFDIGDFVWWDIDGDGLQDGGEPGIPAVTVDLYAGACPAPPDLPAGSPIRTTTTDAAGRYTFTGLAAGPYCAVINAAEFDAGGTLEKWSASPKDVDSNTKDTIDSDGDPVTHAADAVVTTGVLNDTVDFGFTIVSSYMISKELTSVNPARLGSQITFRITITNTGDTWITVLPMQDTYNNTFLTYGFGGDFATPDTVDHVNDGVLNWSDLTSAAPYGFGADLGPGETKTVLINFTARSDTSSLPNKKVVNTVTVANALADPDGPGGPLPPSAPLPTRQGSDGVSIYTPTGVVLERFEAATVDGVVLLTWRTASEAGAFGYNVLRRTGHGELVRAGAGLIPAEHAGQDRGAAYSLVDEGLQPGAYQYVLEVVRLDGTVAPCGWLSVIVPGRADEAQVRIHRWLPAVVDRAR